MKMPTQAVATAAGVLLWMATTAAWAATEVNACGQVLSGTGFLSADLDCSGFPDVAVTIDGGKLDLQGFTLTGGTQGVICARNCKIVSDPPGGMITGAGGCGVAGTSVSIRLQGVTIDGNGGCGAVSVFGRITVIDSTVSNNGFEGLFADSSITVLRSTISGNADEGLRGGRIKIKESLVTGNGKGLRAVGPRALRIKDSMISGNVAQGVEAGTAVNIRDSEISGNGTVGVEGIFDLPMKLRRTTVSGNGEQGVLNDDGRLTVKDSVVSGNGLEGLFQETSELMRASGCTITDNGTYGVRSGNLRILRTTATGNGIHPDCGVVFTCADVGSSPELKFSDLTCDTSYELGSGFPGTTLGICALD